MTRAASRAPAGLPPALSDGKGSHRICVLYADRPAGFDGIRDFSEGLTVALNGSAGVEAHLAFWERSAAWRSVGSEATSVVLQYNPFSYGRGGFAPWLLSDLRRRGRSALCVMVHEPYIPITDGRSAIMGAWQRWQLSRLVDMADAVGVSTPGFRDCLPRRHRARAVHMPVGSPLPDARSRRADARASLGIDGNGLLVAIYGSPHPSRLIGHCVAAIQELFARGFAPVVLNLGSAAPALPGLSPEVRLVRPGPLPAPDLAAHLAAADVTLLPFVDGASTRRTTLIAALQQETCVISTSGALTDPRIEAAPAPVLTPAEDRASFVATTLDLAADARLRRSCAIEGRKLFEAQFGWPIVAQRLLAVLPAPRAA